MNKIIDNILRICLEGELQGSKLVIALEKEIAKLIPYKHEEDDMLKACNITVPEQVEALAGTCGSKIIEQLEATLTKRQLAFMFLQTAMESQNRGGQPGSFERSSFGDSERESKLMDLRSRLMRLQKETEETGKIPDRGVDQLVELLALYKKLTGDGRKN